MTLLADGTGYDPRRAAQQANAVDDLLRIADLSRLVEHDIRMLKTNLVENHYGRVGDETWENAWAGLESAWETVRSELVDDKISLSLTEVPSEDRPATTGAAPPVEQAVATSSTAPVVLKRASGPWYHLLFRHRFTWNQRSTAQLRQALARLSGDFTSFARKLAVAGDTHLGDARLWLVVNGRKQARVRKTAWRSTKSLWAALMSRLAHGKTSISPTQVISPPGVQSLAPQVNAPAPSLPNALPLDREVDRVVERDVEIAMTNFEEHSIYWDCDAPREDVPPLLQNAQETVRSKLAAVEPSTTEAAASTRYGTSAWSQAEEATTTSPTESFVLKPLPWVLGALSPVISSRTMQIHHGCHHSQCIALANRLSRSRKELAGKSPLQIVRWADENARGTELHAAASDAWNHAFFWQSLTPWKKRPAGELRQALDRAFGDYANFADKFALAGATHPASGWLWLVANGRKQVKILTTSDTDCPEVRGHTCLLAIDLWEHAYYFDHQNRRREYLDAVIDRRLDWDFAEQRYRLVLERPTRAPHDSRRGRHHQRRRKPAAMRKNGANPR
jgi:superoxide dismutase, Fe-Mn family